VSSKFKSVLCILGSLAVYSCRTTSDSAVKTIPESSRNISKITCTDISGQKKLVIERSNNELPFPTFHIEVSFQGNVSVKVGDAPVTRNEETSFMVQKITTVDNRDDIEVSAGVNWSDNDKVTGFYMEAANGGMSPLPGMQFNKCEVEEINFDAEPDAEPTDERRVKKVVCYDNSGNKRLVIERSINELPFPTFHVSFFFNNFLKVNVLDAMVTEDSSERLVVGKVTDLEEREGIEVTAGIDWSEDNTASGFYQEAANEGASPLPGTDFPKCKVETY